MKEIFISIVLFLAILYSILNVNVVIERITKAIRNENIKYGSSYVETALLWALFFYLY